MRKIAVRTCGQPGWPRYYLLDDAGRVWTGRRWSRNPSKAMLWADWNAVSHEYRRLEEEQWSGVPVKDFEGVITLRVWSARQYTVEQLHDYMHRAVRILLDHEAHGTGPVSDSMVRIDIDWAKLSELQPRDQR